MHLLLERPDYQFFLRGADGGSALVNTRRLHTSFIIAPDRLVEAAHQSFSASLGAAQPAHQPMHSTR